ncbi:unnamed protein product, partial [Rotaria magnacalcarata]
MKLKQEPSTSSIQWTCDHIKSSEEIFHVWSKFKTTKKLTIEDWGGTNLQNAATRLIVFSSHFNQFRLDKLRSLTFLVNYNFLLKSQQLPFLHLLLSAAPQLMDLTIDWNHIMSIDSVFARGLFAVSPLLNLRHLHLYFCNGYESISLPKLIDISILSKYFPRLVSLWTSRCGLHPDENLAELIISLVTYFEQLVEIIINKGSSYRRDGFHGLDKLLGPKKQQELSTMRRLFGVEMADFQSWSSFVKLMNRPEDPSSLAAFRILFGILMMLDIPQEHGMSHADLYYPNEDRKCQFPLFNFLAPFRAEYMVVIYFIMFL